jgi:hypothetical protein
VKLAALLVLVAALGCEPQTEAQRASPGAAAVMHDHTPHHGGAVSMAGELHIETVAHADGRLRVYLSDLRRQPLPTAGVTGSVTVALPDGRHVLPLSPAGESLEAVGPPLPVGDVRVRVALVRDGLPVEVHQGVAVGIAQGLVGLPRRCEPVVGPAGAGILLPACTVRFPRMVRALAALPDGRTLLVAVFAHGVSLWRLPEAEATGALDPMPGSGPDDPHPHPVDTLAVRPDGREVAVATRGSILRYALPDGRMVGRLPRDHRIVDVLAYSADGARLLIHANGVDGVQTVGVEDGREVSRLLLDRPLSAAAVMPSGDVVLASEAGPVSIFRHPSSVPHVVEEEGHAMIVALVGEHLLRATADGTVSIRSLATGRIVSRSPSGSAVLAVAVQPGDRTVAIAANDGAVHLVRVADGRRLGTLDWHTSPVQAVAWAGPLLVTGDVSGQLAVWDLADSALQDVAS